MSVFDYGCSSGDVGSPLDAIVRCVSPFPMPAATVTIIKDRATLESRGFGFVTFKDATAADAALTVTHFIDGRHVDVKAAVAKRARSTRCVVRIAIF